MGDFNNLPKDVLAKRLAAMTRICLAREAERDRLKRYAESASEALRSVRPLGGSELFTRIEDDLYFADPVVCAREIATLRKELHEARITVAKARAALR